MKYLFVTLDSKFGVVGPLVIPGETACLECFQTRMKSGVDRNYLEVADLFSNGDLKRSGSLAYSSNSEAFAHLIAGFVALDLRNFAISGRSSIMSRSLFIDPQHLEIEVCNLIRNPFCKTCAKKVPLKNLYLPLSVFLEMNSDANRKPGS